MANYGRWASQAARDALLKFGPQRSNLADLIKEAQERYGQTSRAGHVTALGTKATINQTIPQIRQIFAGAEGGSKGTAQLLTQALAGAPDTSAIKQGAAAESATQLQRLIDARASNEARLKQGAVAAQAGAQYSELNARKTLAKELQKALTAKGRISGEEGTFAASEADKLAHEQEGLEQRERASQRTATSSAAGTAQRERASERGSRTSRENAQERGGGKGGPKPQSASSMAKAASTIRQIEAAGRVLHQEGHSRKEIVAALSAPSVSGKTPKGSTFKTPSFPADVLMNAALDSVEGYGRVSRGTLKELRALGYTLKALRLQAPSATSEVRGSSRP